jgi:hypothetical protein
MARTRRGNEALKAAASRALSLWGGGRADGNVKRVGAPKGVPTASEGNTLEGQAQGRSSILEVLGGSVVDAAKGVAKPRTWHAAAE